MKNSMQNMRDDFWPQAPDSASDNFDLYIKVREVSQICDHLHKITLKSNKDRKKWAKENQIIVENMLDAFLGDSVSAMSGIKLDGEAMELSMILMEKMRFMTTTVHGLLPRKYSKVAKKL